MRVVPPLPTAAGPPYAAYLRVYEPLTAFDEPGRGRWAAAVRRATDVGPAATRLDCLAAEQRAALAGVISLPPRPVPTEDDGTAFVLEVEGVPHVCPVQTRLRSWVALEQLRDTFPDQVLHAFVPPVSLEQADAEHTRWVATAGHRTGGEDRLRILTATWSVPLSWFVAFAPGDRVDPDPAGRAGAGIPAVGTAVVHRTRMSAARRRVARALRTLTRHLADSERAGEQGVELVAEDVETLGRWLEEFHARSWLELDYGGLTALLDATGDTSVADVAAAVSARAAGDADEAERRYEEVAGRWAAVAALQHAS